MESGNEKADAEGDQRSLPVSEAALQWGVEEET
jgi:hypothetical protein